VPILDRPKVARHQPPVSLGYRQPSYAGASTIMSTKIHGNPADNEVDNAISQLMRALVALDKSSMSGAGGGTVRARELGVVLRSFNIDAESSVVRELIGRCTTDNGIDYHRFTALLSLKLGLSGRVSAPAKTKRPKTCKPNARFKATLLAKRDTFERCMPDHFSDTKVAQKNYNAHVGNSSFERVVPDWDLDHYGTQRIASKNDGSQTPPSAIGSFKWFQHLKTSRRPTSAFVGAKPTTREAAPSNLSTGRKSKARIPLWETTMNYRGASARKGLNERRSTTRVANAVKQGTRGELQWSWAENGNVYEIE